jgi:outer membrane protein OmpA-like peptidoglycan-associated protein
MTVIGSPAALRSASISDEIAAFPSDRRPLILVRFASAADQTPEWAKLVEGLAVDRRPVTELNSGMPSETVIDRIDQAVGNHRQTQRIRRTGMSAAVLLIVAVSGASLAGWQLTRTLQDLTTVRRSLSGAQHQIDEATSRRVELERSNQRLSDEAKTLEKTITAERARLAETRKEADLQKRGRQAQIAATDEVWRLVDQAAEIFQTLYSQNTTCEGGTLPSIITVFFYFDRISLSDTAKKQLDDFAECCRRAAERPSLLIEGHIAQTVVRDEDLAVRRPAAASPEYGLAISERRAMIVRDYLVERGIPSSRMQAINYGGERPRFADNLDLLNNRAEIRVRDIP